MHRSSGRIAVLHVDDDPEFADLAAEFLERRDERLDVESATSASDGLERLARGGIDCVVSDYDMPDTNGIEFLEAVREASPNLPFILYTGKGSEEIAGEAISAGVTDYLQKEQGTSQYEVLANRIANVVEQQRARDEAARMEERLRTIAENTNDILWMFTADWTELLFINSTYEELWGHSTDELRADPSSFIDGIHPGHRERVEEAMAALSAGESVDIEYRVNDTEDFGRWVWVQAEPVFDDTGAVKWVVGFARDVTDRKEREREFREARERTEFALRETKSAIWTWDAETDEVRTLYHPVEELLGTNRQTIDGIESFLANAVHPDDRSKVMDAYERAIQGDDGRLQVDFRTAPGTSQQRWIRAISHLDSDTESRILVGILSDVTEQKRREVRLEEFARMISHDLRNPLTVAEGKLELAREECSNDHLPKVSNALGRIREIIDDTLLLARLGQTVGETELIRLSAFSRDCWTNLDTNHATLEIGDDVTFQGNPERLRNLFENLFRNAVEHAGPGVTVTVGGLSDGFYVEDDGPGIPEDARERVLELGYSTAQDGTGFGLDIVQSIADAHGWTVDVQSSESGGARFKIFDVKIEST